MCEEKQTPFVQSSS